MCFPLSISKPLSVPFSSSIPRISYLLASGNCEASPFAQSRDKGPVFFILHVCPVRLEACLCSFPYFDLRQGCQSAHATALYQVSVSLYNCWIHLSLVTCSQLLKNIIKLDAPEPMIHPTSLSLLGDFHILELPTARDLGNSFTPWEVHLGTHISPEGLWSLHLSCCMAFGTDDHHVNFNRMLNYPCSTYVHELMCKLPCRTFWHAMPCLSILFAMFLGAALPGMSFYRHKGLAAITLSSVNTTSELQLLLALLFPIIGTGGSLLFMHLFLHSFPWFSCSFASVKDSSVWASILKVKPLEVFKIINEDTEQDQGQYQSLGNTASYRPPTGPRVIDHNILSSVSQPVLNLHNSPLIYPIRSNFLYKHFVGNCVKAFRSQGAQHLLLFLIYPASDIKEGYLAGQEWFSLGECVLTTPDNIVIHLLADDIQYISCSITFVRMAVRLTGL